MRLGERKHKTKCGIGDCFERMCLTVVVDPGPNAVGIGLTQDVEPMKRPRNKGNAGQGTQNPLLVDECLAGSSVPYPLPAGPLACPSDNNRLALAEPATKQRFAA